MLITTGRVSGGSIKVEGDTLPDGTRVTILSPEDGETFELGADHERELLAAINEADRGESISASEMLEQVRKL